MSPDKVASTTSQSASAGASSSPSSISADRHHSIVIVNNNSNNNSTSAGQIVVVGGGSSSNCNSNSNGSSSSSSGSTSGGSSSSNSSTNCRASPLPGNTTIVHVNNNNSDRNNNNINSNNHTGSSSQSNANSNAGILHLNSQSVIQSANQQSVIISSTAGTALQPLKHVLVNSKHHPGSVIQSTSDGGNEIQLISPRNELEAKVGSILEDESKKRREVLERRPSYRKILNDLSSAEVAQFTTPDIKHDPDHHSVHHHQNSSGNNNNNHNDNNNNSSVVTSAGVNSTSSHQQQQQSAQSVQQQTTITVATAAAAAASSPFLKVLPASTIHLAGPGTGSQDGGLTGLSALAVNPAAPSGATGTIVQYHGQDGQPFFVPVSAHYANGGPHSFNSPVTVSPADLHTYQLGRTGSGGSNSQQMTSGGVMMASPNMTGHMPGEGQEVSKKREMRLLKNREAAKECRRKKKEYIKCLENRVAVLENQNKALIDELKSLKELYCSNKND